MKSTTEIAIELGCTGQTVRNICKYLGIAKAGKNYRIDKDMEKAIKEDYANSRISRYGEVKQTKNEKLIVALQNGFELISNKIDDLAKEVKRLRETVKSQPPE